MVDAVVRSYTLLSAKDSAADVEVSVEGFSTAVLMLKRSAGTSTTNFFASVNGTDYYAIRGTNTTPATATVGITTSTGAENWTFDVRGFKKFKLNLSAISGGNMTAVMNLI